MRNLASFIGVLAVFFATSKNQPLVKSVNPFIGTGGHGHTYPGASLPFGMVQLSPDTRLDGWDGCSGYHYSDSIIFGFSHTHLSGTGIADYNDLLITPFTKNPNATKTYDLASSFSKNNEHAEPGFYEVTFNNQIKTQLTTTTRSGFHSYQFPQNETPYLSFDLQHRDQLLDVSYTLISPTKIVGHRISKAWANEQHFYFTIEFNQPYELVYEGSSKIFPKNQNSILKNTSFRIKFKQPSVLVKVGASFTSIANSQLNLQQELPHWNFELAKSTASQIWEKELSKVTIEEKDPTKRTIFYTALYHSFLNPNTYSDVNGEYRGVDGKIHKTKSGHTEYTVFSLWDTFRATHPLLNLLQPERSEDFIQTFLNHYQQSGRLPVWELAGNETECMIGYHAAPVILDAFRQKIPMDVGLAAQAMVASGNADVFGLPSYRKYGYVRSEDESEDVSRTLEYAYDDWCTAKMADIAGDRKNTLNYLQRSYHWMNVFDPKPLFFKGKSNAEFDRQFDPAEVNFHYTEANAWQYSMFVPHHYREYTSLAGGNEKVLQHLDQLFTTDSKTNGREQADITGLIGQYAHGNEPSHHMAYFYHVLNSFEKGSKMVHQILSTQYHNQPDGLSGNEDCGQMSSWYNWSALGLYPFCPGDGNLVTSLPYFKKAVIQLPNGKKLTIKNSLKSGFNAQPYWNGKPLETAFLSHDLLREGGTLDYRKKDNTETATGKTKKIDVPYVAVPVIHSPSMTFTESISIQLESIQQLPMLVSTDGKNWKPSVDNSMVLFQPNTIFAKAYRVLEGTDTLFSPVAEAQFFKRDSLRRIQLNYEYSKMYNGGGKEALIDGIRGGNAFNAGGWQGTQTDLEATVALGKVTSVSSIGLSCLQHIGAWIVLPSSIEISTSTDGKSFSAPQTYTFSNDLRNETNMKRVLEAKVDFKNVQYVKLKAKNYGKLPDWHLGAGGQAWIFADELIIR